MKITTIINRIRRDAIYCLSTTVIIAICIFSSCSDYLDVVPDNTVTVEKIFSTKEGARKALAKAYAYLPLVYHLYFSPWELGDEYIATPDADNQNIGFVHTRIMRGLQTANSPYWGYWSGSNGGNGECPNLYQAINNANIFLKNINLVRDMSNEEKKDWTAQVKFLKGYYAFLLLQEYGPIILSDDTIDPNASSDELFRYRSSIDECFDFILRWMDEAIPDLKEQAGKTDLGQIDKVGAAAIKARVTLFRASPFYNGNKEFYSDFKDQNGKPFFPQDEKQEKWKDAVDAIEYAIQLAESNGRTLYTYKSIKSAYVFDRPDIETNTENMQKYYDLRMMICEPWNEELLWGFSNLNVNDSHLQYSTQIVLPGGYEAGGGISNSTSFALNWLGASYQVMERYYTKNGLPIAEDLTFDRALMYNITYTPPVSNPDYKELAGIMQPEAATIGLYLNREMRFYAHLGLTGSYWRSHQTKIPTSFLAEKPGGWYSSRPAFCIPTGIGIQKFVHPESTAGDYLRTIKYPYPLIRLADLYLMKAEALNEYSGPSPDAYEAINKVRRRAGIPDVEVVWSNPSLAKTVNKHTKKEGFREIILQERGVELAFEGNHYWDMIRYKKAHIEFTAPIMGWNYKGNTPEMFFVQGIKQVRKFTVRDYLWPIDLNELNTNGNLIQNPGWGH